MKLNKFVGVILVIVATNLFTYAATRYWVGDLILTNALERAKAAMDKQRTSELLPNPGQSSENQILMAISMTEGLYHGENNFIFYCWLTPSLILTGLYFLSRKVKTA
jgi:hypothetical protein